MPGFVKLTEVDYEFIYLINDMQSHCMQTLLVLPLNNLVPKSKKLATSNVCSQCGVSVLSVAGGGHRSPHFSWPQLVVQSLLLPQEDLKPASVGHLIKTLLM